MYNTFDKIALMCMDARMNFIADSINDGKTLFIRNAAGTPNGAIKTLENIFLQNPISKIIYYPHTDCGACKFTYSLLSKKESSTKEVEENLVSILRKSNLAFASSEEVIKVVHLLGVSYFKNTYPNLNIDTKIIDTSTTVNGDKAMLILPPSSETYSHLCDKLSLPFKSTYVSQHSSIEESICDVQLAKAALGIKNFTVLQRPNFATENAILRLKEVIGKEANLRIIVDKTITQTNKKLQKIH
ncbi:MAG: hypothetical protein ACP5M9_00570 [Candidatus Micrarchaeia archaeon]